MATSRFDQAAATWDEAPQRIALSRAIVAAILAQVPVRPEMTAVDYGCGTGLVTLALQAHVARITGIDSSPGMLAKLREKVDAGGFADVDVRLLDLSTTPAPADLRADLIVSAMTLHHVADIPALLRALAGMLNPGGYVALADLDTEDGSFHGDPTDVHHHGIDRTWLAEQLAALGFQEIAATTAHIVERPVDGVMRRYPVFLVSGRRPSAPVSGRLAGEENAPGV